LPPRTDSNERENYRALAKRTLRHTWSGPASLSEMRGQQVRMALGNMPFPFIDPLRG
jgi:hypothetical protein